MGTLPDPRDTKQSTGVWGHRRRASCRASPEGLFAVEAPSWNLKHTKESQSQTARDTVQSCSDITDMRAQLKSRREGTSEVKTVLKSIVSVNSPVLRSTACL